MLTSLVKQGRAQVRRHVVNLFGLVSHSVAIHRMLEEHDSLCDDPEQLVVTSFSVKTITRMSCPWSSCTSCLGQNPGKFHTQRL